MGSRGKTSSHRARERYQKSNRKIPGVSPNNALHIADLKDGTGPMCARHGIPRGWIGQWIRYRAIHITTERNPHLYTSLCFPSLSVLRFYPRLDAHKRYTHVTNSKFQENKSKQKFVPDVLDFGSRICEPRARNLSNWYFAWDPDTNFVRKLYGGARNGISGWDERLISPPRSPMQILRASVFGS